MKKRIYFKEVKPSQGKYSFTYETGEIQKVGGAQGSYNIPEKFVQNEINIFEKSSTLEYDRRDKDGDPYILKVDYKLQLGDGVIWLIGEEFRKRQNGFVMSRGYSNNKPQMYRSVYNKLYAQGNDEYEWFIKLYDKNISGSEVCFEVDEENKILLIDVKFKFKFDESMEEEEVFEHEEITYDINLDIGYQHNRILFGAPGTGKSYKLETEKTCFGERFERVTFHPNYSYGQFVGTYKPVPIKIDGKDVITYKYVPGPFMRMYVQAIKSIQEGKNKNFLLVIEEINRANVASVFGDVFQLLDRKNGESEYSIAATEDMKAYLKEELACSNDFCDKLRIPKNLYIWATMNSADQGVQPMDTAFKRRWDFEYIDIDENEEGIANIEVVVGKGESIKTLKWNDIRKAINNSLSKDCRINEDKLIGPYFISSEILKTNGENGVILDNEKFIETFKNKVIMYLYEDAGKQFRNKIFKGCDSNERYSGICKAFDDKGIDIFGDEFLDNN